MFPSPSLAPPLLSLSESPPLFWGIPDVDALDELLLAELEAAGALEDLLDELEPPPQPATAMDAITRRPAAQRAIEPLFCVVISLVVLCEVCSDPLTRRDVWRSRSFLEYAWAPERSAPSGVPVTA